MQKCQGANAQLTGETETFTPGSHAVYKNNEWSDLKNKISSISVTEIL